MGCLGGANTVVKPVKIQGEQSVEEKFEGPTENRVCRDVFFLLIFIAFLGGLGWLFYYSIEKGNPNALIYGTDSYGNVCNQKNKAIPSAAKSGRDTTGLRYLLYFDTDALEKVMQADLSSVDSVFVCVKMCPNETLTSVADLQAFHSRYGASVCNYDVPTSAYAMDGDKCPENTGVGGGVGPYVPVMNRCVPLTLLDTLEAFGDLVDNILDLFDDNFGEKCVDDLKITWKEIIYLCLAGVGISIVMLVLLRFFTALLVYTVVFVMAVGAVAATGFCWYSWYKERTDAWLGISIGVSVVAVIILLVLMVMWKRIRLVVQLFREAGKAIAKMPSLLFQPFLVLILLGGSMAAMGYMFFFIVTTRKPQVDTTTNFVSFEFDDLMKGMFFYYLLGLIWVSQFIVGCERLVVSGAVALWYFTRDKSKLGYPIMKSIYRLIRYHMGSVAFGSLIIALVVLARWILSFIENRLNGKQNFVAKFFLKCLTCCLWCFEKILKFINANAYIEIAIHGYGFCKAARTAFMVIVDNALRVMAINSVGAFVLFLAKAGTVAVVAVIGIELFRDKEEVNYVWLPITLSCLFSYFIASCLIGVYEMAIDAIFICFVEDCGMNDGVSKPYFMSMGLMEYVKNSDESKKAALSRKAGKEQF
ncbi:choline transporter-like protein 1 [Babylonia areolata]|uniref:choline transporter-like protein 1 n=1 Tax=Babylonia areolata TaxID=304850 RepID=UPI003FD0E7E3